MTRALLSILLLAIGGCTTVVIPPANPLDPAPVFIADYGRHSSLVLPRGDGRLVEYSYGQFAWYALEEDEWWRVPALLFVPQQGALGREEWEAPATAGGVRRHRWVEAVMEVEVAQAQLDRLLARLDARFAAGADTEFRNDHYGLTFVYDEDDYWIGHSCNTAVAEWLRELDCAVPSVALSADYDVRPPASPVVEPARPDYRP